MRLLLLIFLLLTPLVAHANSITFTNAVTSITLPAGFSAGFQGQMDANGWKYASNGDAAIRYMEPMGALTADQYGNVSYLWLAALTQTPFAGAITFAVTLDVCKAGECTPATFSGAITSNGTSGLAWQSHGAATTVALGGQFYYLTPLQNPIRGWNSTLDPSFSVRGVPVAQTAEPATLTLLGLGMLGIARRLRKKP